MPCSSLQQTGCQTECLAPRLSIQRNTNEPAVRSVQVAMSFMYMHKTLNVYSHLLVCWHDLQGTIVVHTLHIYTHSDSYSPFDPWFPRVMGKTQYSPYTFSRKWPGGLTWTHKFLCLADTKQDYVPSAVDKHKLKNAWLEKNIGVGRWWRLGGNG